MYFSDIADELKYPAKYRQRMRAEHTKIIEYVTAHFKLSRQWQRNVLKLMNTVTCLILQNESITIDYKQDDMISQTAPMFIDSDEIEQILSRYHCEQLLITWNKTEWDIEQFMT